MNQYSNLDYLYPAFLLIFGLIMIFSPGSFVRKVGYNEERVKAEKWLRVIGVALCIFAPIMAYYFYTKLNA